MKRKLISVLIANLFVASAAMAADGDFKLSGSVGFGLRTIDTSGTDLSKFNEYRDLGNSSVLSEIDLKGRGGSYYLDIFGENLGLDDQYIELKGGQYSVFKYQLYDNRLRHNLLNGGLLPYNGAGTATLTAVAPFPNLNVNTFNRVDVGYKREDLGGMLEFTNNSPWYVRADANEVKFNGTRPVGYAQGTSPGNGFVELPVPLDYKIRNYSLEAGYSDKKGHASVSWAQSKFSNGIPQLNWQNGYFGNGMDAALLPPDNEMTKIGVNGVLKQLPMSSTLAGRYTYSKVTNSFGVQTTNLNSTAGAFTTTAATPATFNGDVKNQSLSLSLNSSPAKALDTRVYYNWYKKDNNSTPIAYAAGVGGGAVAAEAAPTHNSSYRKNNFGIDLGYRIDRQNKLSGGYEWLETKRSRADYDKSKDQKIYAELKNSSLDNLEARFKYQYLQRRSDFQEPFASPTAASTDYFLYAVRRYDVSSFDQNLAKVALDWNAAPLLDLGFEAIYKQNKYKDVILGREKDDRQEYYANLTYGDPKTFQVSLFGDVEFIEYNTSHRYVNAATCSAANSCDPAAPASAGAYTWYDKLKDKNYAVGVGADWQAMSRLKFKGSYIWSKTEGSVDFTALAPSTASNFPTNITSYDNFKRQSLNLKAIYAVDKHWELTGGYAYEWYRYADDQSTGATSTIGTGTSTSYSMGAYTNPNYTASIFYLMAKYKF